MTPLCELADKYQTDKGGQSTHYRGEPTGTCHTYTEAYYRLLYKKQQFAKKVLEIGVNSGASLRMWKEFFPWATVYGLDIRPEVLFHEDRIKCIQADQGDPISLYRALDETGPGLFDLIVDDGSHELGHQIVSMLTLLPYIQEDGIYVIEDVGALHCRPERLAAHVPMNFYAEFIDCPDGIGNAHCPACGGPEALVVIRRR